MKAKVLIVDDDTSMCELLAESLAQQGYEVRWKASAQEALAEVEQRNFDVVLTDINMKEMNGLELCQRATEAHPDLPVIVITAFGSMETAVQAIRAGAYDFITKPFDIDVVAIAIERAVKHGLLQREVQRLQRAVDESRRFDELLGASPAMKEVYDLLERVAESESTVLVTGESGTGKELVARALHRRSKRASGPFVAINCAAMPEQLLESELFGHTKGAFTDARTARPGLFVQAKGGTIFLDEIGDMPLGLQPKLLRALQERSVRPVGGDHETPIDVRVVAASNRDLETAIEERKFREDLYYRINVIHVELPPLRARGADVLLLA
jgi:two-component system response regulator HydG